MAESTVKYTYLHACSGLKHTLIQSGLDSLQLYVKSKSISPLTFLPVQRILNPYAFSMAKIDFGGGLLDQVFIAIPLLASYSII